MKITETLPRHPIRVVAERTGLTPATLRAWERRYNAIKPGRSEAGQRLYSDSDLERLRCLRRLTKAGRSISLVASLSDEEASALLAEDRASRTETAAEAAGEAEDRSSGPGSEWVSEAYQAMLHMDGVALERVLWNATLTLSAASFLDDVVTPLLTRVGAGWVAGEVTPVQEHFASAVVERVLDKLAAPSRADGGPTLVVATVRGERHGLGAKLASTAAILEGWSVRYLGIDLPVAAIAEAAESIGATAVAISAVDLDRAAGTRRAVVELRERLTASIDIVVGGRASHLVASEPPPAGVHVVDGLHGLRAYCGSVGTASRTAIRR